MKTEDQTQAEIVQWFNNEYCLKFHEPRCMIFSVPNGGTRHIVEAVKFQVTGQLAGVSDLIVVFPKDIIFVEVKTETGTQSEMQKEFQKRIQKLGFQYFLVRNLEQFKQIIYDRQN